MYLKPLFIFLTHLVFITFSTVPNQYSVLPETPTVEPTVISDLTFERQIFYDLSKTLQL